MVLKTGRKCIWSEITVNEVFAFEGCWSILCKISPTQALFLESDTDWCIQEWTKERGIICEYRQYGGFSHNTNPSMYGLIPFGLLTDFGGDITNNYLYKLPLSTQRLFKEE